METTTPDPVVRVRGLRKSYGGRVVVDDLDLDDALGHITHPEIRPALGDYEHAKALLAHRLPLYQAAADYTVDIRGLSFSDVAYKVGGLLYEEGLL